MQAYLVNLYTASGSAAVQGQQYNLASTTTDGSDTVIEVPQPAGYDAQRWGEAARSSMHAQAGALGNAAQQRKRGVPASDALQLKA